MLLNIGVYLGLVNLVVIALARPWSGNLLVNAVSLVSNNLILVNLLTDGILIPSWWAFIACGATVAVSQSLVALSPLQVVPYGILYIGVVVIPFLYWKKYTMARIPAPFVKSPISVIVEQVIDVETQLPLFTVEEEECNYPNEEDSSLLP